MHAILEGMAVGSEQDWVMVFTLSGALSVHKILLAFALGETLLLFAFALAKILSVSLAFVYDTLILR